ncbi:hypothetical protein DL89DRAFT_258206 [Linderina pennispora]|uniref:Uncharacterized protein n=1 Tax=Linderina pennispora TaxID=61395 RepID=A0A1Y1W6Z2_9FUNG|nr:uncharacterized protein DL89DRAFT_258206 [Linderina pennispora]ORX69135.1 hypothetical protein DL89DRAFT_258206 [Linderina pennispora]
MKSLIFILVTVVLPLLTVWSDQVPHRSLALAPSVEKRLEVNIGAESPEFLITVPFTVGNGVDFVSGNVSIYFKATRSVRFVGTPGQRYYAYIATTTFIFKFDFVASLGFDSRQSMVHDVLYLDNISATIMSDQFAQGISAS